MEELLKKSSKSFFLKKSSEEFLMFPINFLFLVSDFVAGIPESLVVELQNSWQGGTWRKYFRDFSENLHNLFLEVLQKFIQQLLRQF